MLERSKIFLKDNGVDLIKLMLAMLEQADIATIFALEGWDKEKLEEFKTILFAIPAGVSATQAILAWVETQDKQTKSVIDALFETAFAGSIVAAVGGALTTEAFKVIAPAIFTAALGAKGIYKSLSSAYLFGKASTLENNKTLLKQAVSDAIIAACAFLVSAGVEKSMLEGESSLALIGVVGASIGFIFAGCQIAARLYSLYNYKTIDADPANERLLSDLTEFAAEIEVITHSINTDIAAQSKPAFPNSTARFYSRLGIPPRPVPALPESSIVHLSAATESQTHTPGTAHNERSFNTSINNQDEVVHNSGEDEPRSRWTCGVQ
jgi:hypothetical protein